MKTISIVVPTYNEEHNIPLLYQALMAIIGTLEAAYNFEIIFINDGSKDGSWRCIKHLADSDKRVKGICLSRNFGQQAALRAGYDYATGDAVISMDADLQDPPSLIPSMIEKWQGGAAIVYARRAERYDPFLKRITAHWYYKFLNSIAEMPIPRNVGDFRLIDRKVVDYIKTCKEKAPYLRGMVAWTGLQYDFIDFNRPNRHIGSTAYTWPKLFQLAFDGVTSFSLFPLKLAAFVGFFVIATGSGMFCYISVDTIFRHVEYPLFKWLVTIIYIFMGVQFLLLWILGEYIGRMFEQQKNRPLYFTKELINIAASESFYVPSHKEEYEKRI